MTCSFKEGVILANKWCCISNMTLEEQKKNPFADKPLNIIVPELCGSGVFVKDTYLEVAFGESLVFGTILGLSFRDRNWRDLCDLSKACRSYEEADVYLNECFNKLRELYAK